MEVLKMAKQHGMYGTPTYKSWSEMKYRCGNVKRSYYINISYCEDWKDFRVFLKDMGVRPLNTSLDRINVMGNYEPGNCRWATMITQQNNRSNNNKFEYNGESLTIPQLSRKYGISRSLLANRIHISKMDIQSAINFKKGGGLKSQTDECLQRK